VNKIWRIAGESCEVLYWIEFWMLADGASVEASLDI